MDRHTSSPPSAKIATATGDAAKLILASLTELTVCIGAIWLRATDHLTEQNTMIVLGTLVVGPAVARVRGIHGPTSSTALVLSAGGSALHHLKVLLVALALLLLVGCAGVDLRPNEDAANDLRGELNQISMTARGVRSVAEAYCPAARKIDGAALLCDGVQAAWDPFVTAWWAAWDVVGLYEQGLLAADDAVRAVALIRRSGSRLERLVHDAEVVAQSIGEPRGGSSGEARRAPEPAAEEASEAAPAGSP